MAETWRLVLGSGFTVHSSRFTAWADTEVCPYSQLTTHNYLLEAALNMAIDEAMVSAYRKGGMPPTLRLYTWREPAMTIGYFQEISGELDWATCQSHKVSVIRRITGGRAVLHGQDITYSVVAGPHSAIFASQTLRGTFLTISHALMGALGRLGLKAEAVESSSRSLQSPLCFASPSWSEITCEGRKVIGSAQRRWREGFLQQGSILLSFEPEEFYRLFRFESALSGEARRLEMVKAAKTKVAGLNDFVELPLSPRKVEEALVMGFEQALGVTFEKDVLTPEEIEEARRLALEKYSQDAWNLKRAPIQAISD